MNNKSIFNYRINCRFRSTNLQMHKTYTRNPTNHTARPFRQISIRSFIARTWLCVFCKMIRNHLQNENRNENSEHEHAHAHTQTHHTVHIWKQKYKIQNTFEHQLQPNMVIEDYKWITNIHWQFQSVCAGAWKRRSLEETNTNERQ